MKGDGKGALMTKTQEDVTVWQCASWLLCLKCQQLLAALHIVSFKSIVENSEVASSCYGTSRTQLASAFMWLLTTAFRQVNFPVFCFVLS